MTETDEIQNIIEPTLLSKHQLADKFFKKMMMHPQAAQDFFQQHLPKKSRKHIDWKDLNFMPNSFVDQQFYEKEVDVLYQTTYGEQPLYLYLLCEHQTQPDRWLPLRLLNYLVRIWEFHQRQQEDGAPLPLIYPLLFYAGKQKWKHSLDLRTLIKAPSSLIRRYFLKPPKLIQARPASQTELSHHPWSSTFGWVMHHVAVRGALDELKQIFPTLQKLVLKGKLQYVDDVLNFIIAKSDGDPVEYQKLIETHFDSPVGEQTMTLAERFEQRGMQQGMQQGEYRRARESAKRMLGKGFSIEMVAELVMLSIEEIRKIQADHLESDS